MCAGEGWRIASAAIPEPKTTKQRKPNRMGPTGYLSPSAFCGCTTTRSRRSGIRRSRWPDGCGGLRAGVYQGLGHVASLVDVLGVLLTRGTHGRGLDCARGHGGSICWHPDGCRSAATKSPNRPAPALLRLERPSPSASSHHTCNATRCAAAPAAKGGCRGGFTRWQEEAGGCTAQTKDIFECKYQRQRSVGLASNPPHPQRPAPCPRVPMFPPLCSRVGPPFR